MKAVSMCRQLTTFTTLLAVSVFVVSVFAVQPRIIAQQAATAEAVVADAVASTRPDHADAANYGLKPEVLRDLDAAMQQQVDDGHVSGIIGLISRNGTIGYYETFGQRVVDSDSAMDRDTLFRIYSMTKPIVAVTAMVLWEEGRFKLDDPISDYLPEWKDAAAMKDGESVPVNTPVTARHLMTHSSGLSYDREGLALGPDDSLQLFSESAARRPLLFQPGTDYRYGYSIDILGRYIEAIEGRPLDVVMRERIFDPLKMDDTEFWVRNPEDRDRVAVVYKKDDDGSLFPAMSTDLVMVRPVRMMGGQGLMSTTDDYARFCAMLLNEGELDGVRILKPDTVQLMAENHLKDIGKVYGLGGTVDGKGRYSWGGAAGTKFWVDPATDSYGVFMIQRWGYEAPTFDVFREHVVRAMPIEGESP